MKRYTATMFCRFNKWHFESTVEASSLEEAYKIARRDYADKTTRLVSVVQA